MGRERLLSIKNYDASFALPLPSCSTPLQHFGILVRERARSFSHNLKLVPLSKLRNAVTAFN